MSEERHKLLNRQLRKWGRGLENNPEMEELLHAVSRSYFHFDQDRELLERSMEISSEELFEKNELLARQNEAMDEFVYRVSHDLKSPAQNLVSMVDLLKSTLPENSGTQSRLILENLEKSGKKLLNRIEVLLEMTRIENLIREKRGMVNVKEVCDEVCQSLEKEKAESGVKLESEFCGNDELPFNHEGMVSLLQNLIANGIRYRSKSGEAWVKVYGKRDEDEYELRVKDNGLGMDIDKIGNNLYGLFKRFHNHIDGSGIGLHLVKKIVDGHGGTIEVQSLPGKGTEFLIRFPVRPA